MSFKIGDRVISRGIYSRKYGAGKIIDINLNVATVIFNNQVIESFAFAMLRKEEKYELSRNAQ